MNGFYPTALKFSLGIEQGMVNNPADPGGATNFGVTQATLDDAREQIQGLPIDVKDLTIPDVTQIYQIMFWNVIEGDALPNWAALAMFDAAVNSGPGEAVKWMQEATGAKPDSEMGVRTLASVLTAAPAATLREFHAQRFYNDMLQVNEEKEFGLGWSRRILLTHDTATALIPSGG
jgi:lysozyme family protein